jgi:uncharacterized protein YdiU (UPF0061 family)
MMQAPRFDNSYARLPERLFARLPPTPVAGPGLIVVNQALARGLGLDPDWLAGPDGLAMLAGNAMPVGAEPIAQAYAGHQFGNWNPSLGDGRAILLGEVVGPLGRRDIQLKGAGRTPWSRGGDGRAWLGPVLREYLCSEAMAALGVPTTRALAAVTTGEQVWREQGALPGAVLARVAASHIRVGTFQFFAARGDRDALAALADHARARHFPDAVGVEGLLEAMMAAQARLIARWMGLGFIHGVMNTDNCAISGETIDYGPCAFMDGFHPGRVFSSIDRGGRYAWGNQPQIALWNIAQFATALVALMPDADAAVERFTTVIGRFADLYEAAWLEVFGAKLGIAAPGEGDRALIEDLLRLMAEGESDFTLTFAALGTGTARDQVLNRDGFDAWAARWQARGPDRRLMARVNPRVIPRTHLIEAAIGAGVEGDFAPFHAMLAAVTRPFAPDAVFAAAPTKAERVLQTFCGT